MWEKTFILNKKQSTLNLLPPIYSLFYSEFIIKIIHEFFSRLWLNEYETQHNPNDDTILLGFVNSTQPTSIVLF